MSPSPSSTQIQNYLKPEHLRSVKGLELLARATVNSLLPGIQKSGQLGAGQEFSQYRSYQPGDDLRRLDWKLYGRSDRYYVREANVDRRVSVHFVLDASASMLHEDQGLEKIDFARYIIATLAWLALQQGDAVGLYAVSEGQYYKLNPRPGRQFLQRFLLELVQIKGAGSFPEALHQRFFPPGSAQREIVIFISDFYQKNNELSRAVTTLRQAQRQVLLFHLMGQNELELNFSGARTFEDLETGQLLQVDSPAIRSEYRRRLEQHLSDVRRKALSQGLEYELFRMDEPIGTALQGFLKIRS